MGKKRKICGIVFSAALVAASTGALYACGDQPRLNESFDGGTVCYELPTDGSTPEDHTGIENIGYMAYRLKNQTNYYSLMEGTVDTIINQSVTTYKQYNDGVMIATDISISSLVKTAKQLCYVGDSVLWREAAKGAGEWDGLNTEWKTDEPAHITTTDFKNRYGLPATEFSVYILNEDTILEADDVVNNGDGTYSQTFRLSTDGEKAVYYYRQQMLSTGGLDEWPEYESIEITYKFDSSWQILESYIEESYRAKMVMSVSCSASYTTVYEYNTEKAYTDDYETFYSKYADKPVTSMTESDGLSAVNCLTQAFGNVLTGPATFGLQLDVNGEKTDGAVYLNLSDMKNPEVRARLGNLRVWYAEGAAYLAYGDIKARLTVSQLTELLQSALSTNASEGLSLDTNALLSQLGAGTFTVTDSNATLAAALDLFGMHLPVVFSFNMQDGVPSLDYLGADLTVSDQLHLGVKVTESDETLPALSVGEKAGYIEVSQYLGDLYNLFTQDALEMTLSYHDDKISVDGIISVDLKKGTVQGNLDGLFSGVRKSLKLAYADSYVYLDLDGFKGKLSVTEALSLVNTYFGETEFDIGKLVGMLLSEQFASLFSMNEGRDVLHLAVNGTELLREFGVDFKLGSISLAVSNERLELSVFGATVFVTAGEPFTIDTQNYVDMTGFAKEIFSIVSQKQLSFDGLAELAIKSDAKKTVASLYIQKGIVSWKDGISVYLEASLLAGETHHDFLLSAGKDGYKIAYGPVGAAVTQEDLPALESALVALYNRIAAVVNEISEGETLPQVASLEEMLTLLKGSGILSSALQKFDFAQLTGLLDKIQILPPAQANGIVKIAFGDLTAELLNAKEEGCPEFQVDFAKKNLSVSLDMKARAYEGTLPEIPDGISFMGTDEIAELFDYVGSAAEMLTAENISLNLQGAVTSTDEAYADTDGIKYNFNATFDYYSGSSFPVHIDLENSEFRINPDLFTHIEVDVRATHKTDSEFHLDFLIMNGQEDDEELGLYLSVSRYRKNGEHAVPLKIYMPMSEFATVGASLVSVLGIDIDFLNQTFLSTYLEAKTVSQLRALGKSLTGSLDLKKMIGSFISTIGESQESGIPAKGSLAGFIKSVDVLPASENAPASLAVMLGTGVTFGVTKDTYLQTKTDADGNESTVSKGYISAITLSDVVFGEAKTDELDFTCAITPACNRVPAPELTGYYNATGIGALLKVVANSITTDTEVISGEETRHEYKINRNFYIDGSANLSAFSILNASIDIVAISVTIDEKEQVGINIRLEYQGVSGGMIEGDSTLDITIKDGMVYMKRTQYTYFNWGEKTYDTPVVLYRAMPLDNLFGNFLEQLKYMLNFGSTVTKLMNIESKPAEPLKYEPDYGEQAANVLTSFTYLQDIKDEGGNVTAKEGWTLVLNGDGLTNGVMGDLNITLKTNADGTALRGIDFNCPKLGISGVNLTATLTYRNPCGIMEKDENGNPVNDITQSVGYLGDKLKDTINSVDWEQKKYLETRTVYAVYVAEGNALGNPVETYLDTTTGEILGGGSIPEVPAKRGHSGEWGIPVDSNGGYTVNAVYTPNLYSVTLTDGTQTYETQMRYGSHIRFTSESGEVAVYTVGDGVNEFTIPVVPEKEGHEGVWSAVSVSENAIEIGAEYTAKSYTVTITSGDYIEGWTEENGLYVNRITMTYGGTIVTRFRGNNYVSYTVIDGDNVFALPELPLKNGHSAIWETFEYGAGNTYLSAEYAKDTVVYHSEIALDGNGTQTIEDSFNTDTYTLRSGITANGYTFLGWFVQTESGWKKADATLSLTGAGARVQLEALWAKDLSISVSCVRSGRATKYQYQITTETTGGELVGAAASAVQIKTRIRSYLSMGTTESEGSHDIPIAEENYLIKEYTGTTDPCWGKTCTHSVVDVTYTYQGEELHSQHQFKSISSPMSNG